MPMNPRLLRPLAANRFAAVARDAGGSIIQPVLYADGGENYVAHIFTSSGTLKFLRAVDVEYLIVAGGGGGGTGTGSFIAGGGGAGGLLTNVGGVPLVALSQSYNITVGAGGAANTNGSNSSALGVTATGGGAGGRQGTLTGNTGGSGGGAVGAGGGPHIGANGTSGQGNKGGDGLSSGTFNAGGGGGSGAVGGNAGTNGGVGGSGISSSITNTATTYAGGGGGGALQNSGGTGGTGGGGTGGQLSGNVAATAGEPNTGGGGGGGSGGNASAPFQGGNGGSGIVIVRYKRNAEEVAWDSDALAYIAAVEAADNAVLEPGIRAAYNDFIVGCKSDGIWDSIKASCILAGARTLAGALVPLVGSAPTNVNFVSGDYDRKTGLVGNGTTKYLDSNRANNADPQDNQSMGVWLSAYGAGTNDAIIGSGSGSTSGATHIIAQKSPTVASDRFTIRSRGQNLVFGSVVQSHATGLHGISRSSAGSFSYLLSGLSGSASLSSTTPDSGTVNVFARGVESLLPATHRLAYYWVGESLNLALLDSRVTTLYNAIGAAI